MRVPRWTLGRRTRGSRVIAQERKRGKVHSSIVILPAATGVVAVRIVCVGLCYRKRGEAVWREREKRARERREKKEVKIDPAGVLSPHLPVAVAASSRPSAIAHFAPNAIHLGFASDKRRKTAAKQARGHSLCPQKQTTFLLIDPLHRRRRTSKAQCFGRICRAFSLSPCLPVRRSVSKVS